MKNFNALLLGTMVMIGSSTSTLGATTVNTTVNKVQTQVQTQVQAQQKVEVVKCYTTLTGTKYHKANCKHVKKSKFEKVRTDAMLTHEPCKTCHSALEVKQLTKQAQELRKAKAQSKDSPKAK